LKKNTVEKEEGGRVEWDLGCVCLYAEFVEDVGVEGVLIDFARPSADARRMLVIEVVVAE
jgi:hypothetical protein